MAIKLNTGGQVVMKEGKLSCSCCGGCTPCAEDVASTYSLDGPFFPVSLLQTTACEWVWIGDMAVSGDYDSGGPDTISLACYLESPPSVWALGFSGPTVGTAIWPGPSDPDYPTGTYTGEFDSADVT